MSVEVAGQGGAGAVTVYTLPDGYAATLQTLSFKVVTGAGAEHMIRLTLESPVGEPVARLDDLNVGAAGQTNFYTYGIGLNASACTLPAGLAVTDALPWTELVPGTSIILTPIDGTGVTLAGDTISEVLMHLDETSVATTPTSAPLPLTLLPGAAT